MPKINTESVLIYNTPIEDYTDQYGLYVKREDLSCPPPGPPFSKTRGVYAHVQSRSENLIGVLDTYHSQAGHAVARMCQVLGKQCINYYPEFKYEPGPRAPQLRAQALGAKLEGIPAGMSAVLWYQARKRVQELGGYMMPNALKLSESVIETAKEVPLQHYDTIIIPSSSGTIAAGVIRGVFVNNKDYETEFIVHMGYSRSVDEMRDYIISKVGIKNLGKLKLKMIDEKYSYKNKARDGITPPWPCNEYYDLKAFRWWIKERTAYSSSKSTLFWNIG